MQGRVFARSGFAVTSYCRDTVAVCIYVASLKRTALAVVGCQYGLAHAFLTPTPRNVFFLTTLTSGVTRYEAAEAVASVNKMGVALQKLC